MMVPLTTSTTETCVRAKRALPPAAWLLIVTDSTASRTASLMRVCMDERLQKNRPARWLASSTLILRKSIRNPKMEFNRARHFWARKHMRRDAIAETGDDYQFWLKQKIGPLTMSGP